MSEQKFKKKTQPLLFISRHRKLIALVFFAFITFVAVRHQIVGGGPTGSPSLCSYCPVGGIASLYSYVTDGTMLHRIHQSSLIILIALLVLTLFSRRGFCGWICPFGTLQEWLAWVGVKLFRRKIEPPAWLDRWLRYVKYVVLLWLIAGSWYLGTLVFRDYDPYLAFNSFGLEMDELPVAYAVLGVVLVGSLFVERFWCRYLCPLGAFLAIFGKLGFMVITHEEKDCSNCSLAIKRCPVGIDPNAETEIRSAECIQCMECVAVCPVHNAMHIEIFGHRLRPRTVGISIVASFLIVIGAAQITGNWETKGGRAGMDRDVHEIGAAAIRGWMTLEDIRDFYGFDEQKLRLLLGIPSSILMETQLRTFEQEEYEGVPDPEEIRDILEDYQPVGKPSELSVGQQGKGGGPGASGLGGQEDGRPFIRGNTTIQEALDMSGKTLEQFEKDWGIDVELQTTIRDVTEKLDVEMWDLRDYFGQKR
jgi:ferredoxin